MSQNRRETNVLFNRLRNTLGPLLLLILCPPIVMIVWYINVQLGGSLERFWGLCAEQGLFTTIYQIWSPVFFGSATAWKIIAIFAAVQLIFMKALPGKPFYGPVTPKGNVPVYKANGVASFLLTLGLFYLCAYPLHLFSPTLVYDHFGALLGALNIFSLFFCLMLYIKGRIAPSSEDREISGNPIFDYYWGIELYPRIFGWDVKMFTNCRFGLMGWGVIILSFAAKQKELYGLSDSMCVAVALQLIYIFKFFNWETGYLKSLDIMHDHAGYYICWGCLVWVPCIYTSPVLYLVNHPYSLGWVLALSILLLGAFSILINYLADQQRQKMRESNGEFLVWRKKPILITANYKTEDGENRQNLLLASGWWGISRHFHYIPEITGAFFWTLPALFHHFLPYFYLIFLTLLLIDRAIRDDKRCAQKYGEDWKIYCSHVRYKMIPFIF